MGSQFNIKDMPERSAEQLQNLHDWSGYTKTQAVLIAIERLWLTVKEEREQKMQNITITADVVEIMRGHHQGLSQDGNTISFKAKEKAQFGPLGAWYYLLPGNTIVEHVDPPRALPGLTSTIQSFLGRSWKELKDIEAKRVAK